jgi:hypothetical protein
MGGKESCNDDTEPWGKLSGNLLVGSEDIVGCSKPRCLDVVAEALMHDVSSLSPFLG